MERRDFLKTSGAGVAALSASQAMPALGQGAADLGLIRNPVLVKIFLRGGQDQLNSIIPYRDKTYYKIRPTIAIPEEESIPLDNQWAFHPALEPLKPWFDKGRMTAIVNSGSKNGTRSHFDAQDFMEYACPGNRSIYDGWLNRYLKATANPRGEDPYRIRSLAMQERLPRSMRGSYPAVAVPPNLREMDEVLDVFEKFYGKGEPEKLPFSLKGLGKKKGPAAVKKLKGLAAMGADGDVAADPVMASGRYTISYLRRLKELLYPKPETTYGSSREIGIAGEGVAQEYPGGWFASRMQALARVIKSDAGLQVAATDIGGWDHHIGLGGLDGTLNRMLTFFAASLAAFMEDLGPHLDRTLILVSTEFGRNAPENGNDGSDHGHAGLTWLMGGRVRGGRIYGRWTGLEKSELYQGRDLEVTTDFREVYADVLRQHMGFEPPEDFFPGYTPSERGLGIFES